MRLLFQGEQFARRICFTFNRRFAADRVKQGCAETVDIAAEIFSVVVQPLGRDVIRRAPNFSERFSGDSGQSEIADLCEMFVGKKNVGRFHVPMNKPFGVGSAQPFGRLNPRLKDLLF